MKTGFKSLSRRERILLLAVVGLAILVVGDRVLRSGYLARRAVLAREIKRQEGLLERGRGLVQQAEAIRRDYEAMKSRLDQGTSQAANEAQLLREIENAAQGTMELVALDPGRADEAASFCEVSVEFNGALTSCADFLLFLGQRLGGECLSLSMTVKPESSDDLRCQSTWQFGLAQPVPTALPDSTEAGPTRERG